MRHRESATSKSFFAGVQAQDTSATALPVANTSFLGFGFLLS